MIFSKDLFLNDNGWGNLCQTCNGKKMLRQIMRAYPWVDKYNEQDVVTRDGKLFIADTQLEVKEAWCKHG